MQNSLYFNKQTVNSKLIYCTAFSWTKISQKIDKVLLPHNLNTAKFNILMVIKHLGGDNGIKQNEISEQLLTTKSNITKMLDKLELEGYITRNETKKDKRIKLVKITKNGSDLLDSIWKDYTECLDELSPNLPENNKSELLNNLYIWLNSINKS